MKIEITAGVSKWMRIKVESQFPYPIVYEFSFLFPMESTSILISIDFLGERGDVVSRKTRTYAIF